METVGQQKLWSFTGSDKKSKPVSCTAVRHAAARIVRSFMELARDVAELQFMNRDLVLLFRGQSGDYKNKDHNTSLKPRIMRSQSLRLLPTDRELRDRFSALALAEAGLVERYRSSGLPGGKLIDRQKILRWSILQHYEVCDTPLLDVTHSLRIAASFATHKAAGSAYVFVLGVPNVSGAVTASADAGLQIIRLSSVCPPSALRPHYQEGYLLGEYPEMTGMDQKQHYKHYEIDFGRRLVAKFSFDPNSFWNSSPAFPLVPETALYPQSDPLLDITACVKRKIEETI